MGPHLPPAWTPSGAPAPAQSCETVDDAWDSSLVGMEHQKSFALRIINCENVTSEVNPMAMPFAALSNVGGGDKG